MNRHTLMHVRRSLVLGLPLALAGLGGCATTAAPAAPTTPLQALYPTVGNEDCILRPRIHDWDELDDSHLLVYTMGEQVPYLVELSYPSNDIAFNLAIGVRSSDPGRRICGRSLDMVLIPGGSPPLIPIASVKRLTREESKQLLAARHKKVPKGKVADAATDTAPPPAPGTPTS